MKKTHAYTNVTTPSRELVIKPKSEQFISTFKAISLALFALTLMTLLCDKIVTQ